MLRSFGFPNMLGNTVSNIISDHKATASNLKLLLTSDRCSLFGDPYYGTLLQKLTFEQNNTIIADLIIDDIYTSILTFMPQLKVNRNEIKVTSNKLGEVSINIRAINLLDYSLDLYNIKLTGNEEKN